MDAIDPDELMDATEVAAVLGLSSRTAVSVYRQRYTDFPSPVIQKNRCVLWSRQDVGEWRANHPPRAK